MVKGKQHGNYGRRFTEEHRRRIGATHRRLWEAGLKANGWSPEVREKASKTHSGVPLSDEHRRRIVEGKRRHSAEQIECGCAFHSPRASKLSDRMVDSMLSEFPTVEVEVQFGRYRVDAYLPPPYHLAFEADGDYWHGLPGRKEHDAKRDAWLWSECGLPVVRISSEDIDGCP